MKWIILLLFLGSAAFVHLRGKVRHRIGRQLTDHSTFMAPINLLMYATSSVPGKPYLDVEAFPELAPLRDNWRAIRDEALALREAQRVRASDRYDDAGFNSFFRRGWKRFYLKWYGDAHPSAVQHCPRTTALLAGIPEVKAAMFAELPPGAVLQKHRDPYAGSLRYHLGLITPNHPDCSISVDGEDYHWRDGEAVMFDETFIHHAHNATESDRIILFCDIERPLRYGWARAINRFLARTLFAGSQSPNEDGDPTGGVNRAFGVLYRFRLWNKRLKARSRFAYYGLQWLLIGGFLLWLFWPS
ncbi:MAG: aspartyl/asparaginyl beta-hydroxylase domain-containing protein [Xanthomonadaceae bacterium]|nr:aspartyl/asparaginyl beta-hydroxylase domain-containing protein [Xanthomonadaceae bacterium]